MKVGHTLWVAVWEDGYMLAVNTDSESRSH